jgi:ACR3 family arsenite efflux pump ArsB
MSKFTRLIQQNLAFLILFSAFLGLIHGLLFNWSELALLRYPLTFLLIFPQMLNLKLNQFLDQAKLKLLLVFLGLNFLLTPLYALIIGKIFFLDQLAMQLGLILIAILPTGSMTLAWTGITKGNLNAAVTMSIGGLALGSLLLPLYLNLFFSENLAHLENWVVLKKILTVIIIPLILAQGVKYTAILIFNPTFFEQKLKPKLLPISNLALLALVFSILSLRSDLIFSKPLIVFQLIGPLLIFYLGNYLITTLVAQKFFNREDGLALVFSTAMRHLAISLALALSLFSDYSTIMAIMITLAFVIQTKSASWYAHFTSRIFPAKELK